LKKVECAGRVPRKKTKIKNQSAGVGNTGKKQVEKGGYLIKSSNL